MQAFLAVLSLTLGLGQLISSYKGWRAASLVGPSTWLGYSVGALLIALGSAGVVGQAPVILSWTFLAGPLAIVLLLLAGSYVKPPSHPDRLFDPQHGNCERVSIPDGGRLMPALLLKPLPQNETGAAVCLLHGSSDTKHGFKWRLAQALLNEGLTVLAIDLPGHGEYRHRVLSYPDCLSALPAAVKFLRAQPGIERVGALGVSLGGAIALKSLMEQRRQGGKPALPKAPNGETRRQGDKEKLCNTQQELAVGGTQKRGADSQRSALLSSKVDALVVWATPLHLNYNRRLAYREAWQAFRAPVLSLLGEVSVRQLRRGWQEGGQRSRHTTEELFALLDPLESIRRLDDDFPVLLVYSKNDPVAPASFARQLQQAAPHAELLIVKKASHVTLIFMPEVNRQAAGWLRKVLIHN